MTEEELKALVAQLKSGEYNGVTIMLAWIAIEELIVCKAELEEIKEFSI